MSRPGSRESQRQADSHTNPNRSGFDRSALLKENGLSLQEAFELFGVKQDDVADIREKVIMTSVIASELKNAKQELVKREKYEKAAKVRDRLSALHSEFENLQRGDEEKRQKDEVKNFNTAARLILAEEKAVKQMDMNAIEKECENREKALLHAHELEKQQLEDFIARMHRPRVRYSKRLLDMMHSEKHLAKLNQFEDARSLKKRVEQQTPKEEAMHQKSLQAKEDHLRSKLQKKHEFQWAKLQERLVNARLQENRVHDLKAEITQNKLKNHEKSMYNKHVIAAQFVDQYCAVRNGKVRPVIKRREHYHETDATFRGTQLLKRVKGDAIEDVTSLCAIHDFDKQYPDSVEYKKNKK